MSEIKVRGVIPYGSAPMLAQSPTGVSRFSVSLSANDGRTTTGSLRNVELIVGDSEVWLDGPVAALLDVVESAEGPATFNHCVLRDGPCDWEETCPIHDTWSRAQDALARELASATLADLAGIDASIEAGSYQSNTPSHRDPTERHGERN